MIRCKIVVFLCLFNAAVSGAIASEHEASALSLLQVQASAQVHSVEEENEDPRVCVSLAAYEDPPWIDALIENARKFVRPSTKIVIHLNARSNYTREQLAKWNSTRQILINEHRVPVKVFHASILYAHLLNFQRMPEYCEYVIMQASNMMWVRRGMEKAVTGQQFGGVWNVTSCTEFCMHRLENELFRTHIAAPHGLIGWGQHEGAFYPKSVVDAYMSHMTQSLQQMHLTFEGVGEARDDAEEWWIQTFMVNRYNWSAEYGPTLALFVTNGNSTVSMEQVWKVSKGLKPPPPPDHDDLWNRRWGFYAVKRVVRDLEDPVTRLIMNLPGDYIEAGNHEPDIKSVLWRGPK